MTHQQVDVTYSIEETVKVDGIDLAPGKYKGRQIRLGTPYKGQTVWQPWEYRIDWAEYSDLHCDEQVRSGAIKVIGHT